MLTGTEFGVFWAHFHGKGKKGKVKIVHFLHKYLIFFTGKEGNSEEEGILKRRNFCGEGNFCIGKNF